MSPQRFFQLVKATFQEWSEDKASRLSAALAYYAVFSIPPLLLILLVVAGRLLGARYTEDELQTRIIDQFAGLIGADGADAIATMIDNASRPEGSAIAFLVALVTLLFGASGVFAQLQDAMNTIWEVAADPERGLLGTVKDRFFSFTMVAGIAFLLVVSLVVSTAIASLNEVVAGILPAGELLLQIINLVISTLIIIGLFAAIFKVVPDVQIAWNDVWIGAAVTGILYTLGKWLISTYLIDAGTTSAYGAAGSLVVLLLWVYYSANILFLGAEFTQVYANQYGTRIMPDDSAIPLTEEMRAQQGISQNETTRTQESTEKA